MQEQRRLRQHAFQPSVADQGPVGFGTAANHVDQVDVLRFGRGDRALHPAGLAHRTYQRSQPGHAVARARHVRLRLGRHRIALLQRVLQVVQRRFHDRQRRVELVRKPRGQRAQVVGIATDRLEQFLETACEVAHLVGRVGHRKTAALEQPVQASIRWPAPARPHRAACPAGSSAGWRTPARCRPPPAARAKLVSSSPNSARLASNGTARLACCSSSTPRTWPSRRIGTAASSTTLARVSPSRQTACGRP